MKASRWVERFQEAFHQDDDVSAEEWLAVLMSAAVLVEERTWPEALEAFRRRLEAFRRRLEDMVSTPAEPSSDLCDSHETPDYTPLLEALHGAYAQAAEGKGRERHADGRDFLDQPLCRIARHHGVGFATGQAAKKIEEQAGFAEVDRRIAELQGAIVYLAGAILVLEEETER